MEEWTREKKNIENFYTALSEAIEKPEDEEDLGKFLAVNGETQHS